MHSGSKLKKYRLILIWATVIAVGVTYFGCTKEKKENKDEYYVKYEVNSSTIYSGGKLNAVLKAENNQNTTILINTRSPWEMVIGPVKKGFDATLSVSHVGDTYNRLKLYTQISVSKNGSAFAVKKIDNSDAPRNSVQLNYTIDY